MASPDPLGRRGTAAPTGRAIAVIEALRLFDAADHAMRRRTRDRSAPGGTDLAALRFLMSAHDSGRIVTPGDLARDLGLAPSSVTTVVDRLAEGGLVRRAPHPTDRRSLAIEPVPGGSDAVIALLGSVPPPVRAVIDTLSPGAAAEVAGFLAMLVSAMEAGEDSYSR